MTELEAFEAKIGQSLPAPYREFLAGGAFQSFANMVHYHEDDRLDFGIAGLFGLLTDEALQDNHEPWTFFDLDDRKAELSAYLCIGQSITGELILLKLNNGSVHLLETDFTDGDGPEIVHVADTFDAFVSAIISEEDYPTDPDFES